MTFLPITAKDLDTLPQLSALPPEVRDGVRAAARVFPFRTNRYVVEQLIDWDAAPDDPLFRLVFPRAEMLEPADLRRVLELQRQGVGATAMTAVAREIQMRMNPHPAGQMDLNVPLHHGQPLRGVQHKYRETVLFFPSAGQTCHTYCTYCFRWPQFVGLDDLRFASTQARSLVEYLGEHPDVTSVLFTGGDPMVIRTKVLRRYVEPLLEADLPHLASIRFGTKSLAWWPLRFTTDPDADDLLQLFEQIERSGKSVALMAHCSHPRELETPEAQAALRRIRGTGAVVRTQAPLIRGVNDDALAWAEMWRLQVRLGAVPYYMFVERDTGPRHVFEVPLVRAVAIYRDAMARVSGLARTARGPSMSATPGKVVIDGVTEIQGERVFALRFLQSRDPEWIGRPFYAAFDAHAAWLDQLRPAFGEREFFFEPALRRGAAQGRRGRWASPVDRRVLPVHDADPVVAER